MQEITDHMARKFPVSVKGRIIDQDKVALLKNRRNEWELPGGKLEEGESPEACLIREIHEELGLDVCIRGILDAWVYTVSPSVPNLKVLIITYACSLKMDQTKLQISHEHKEAGWFSLSPATEIMQLNMPYGYKESIFRKGEHTK